MHSLRLLPISAGTEQETLASGQCAVSASICYTHDQPPLHPPSFTPLHARHICTSFQLGAHTQVTGGTGGPAPEMQSSSLRGTWGGRQPWSAMATSRVSRPAHAVPGGMSKVEVNQCPSGGPVALCMRCQPMSGPRCQPLPWAASAAQYCKSCTTSTRAGKAHLLLRRVGSAHSTAAPPPPRPPPGSSQAHVWSSSPKSGQDDVASAWQLVQSNRALSDSPISDSIFPRQRERYMPRTCRRADAASKR